MNSTKIFLPVLFAASCVFAGLGCGEKVPIREMSTAKVGITKAESVKADLYAPEEIKAARNNLLESHTQMAKDDHQKAAKEAEAASVKAEEAYNKSLPLLAKDTIATAEQSFEGATEAYAESLAKNEYLRAQTGIKESNDKFQDKQYYDAYLKASAADADARKARDIAIGRRGILSDNITDVNVTVDRARKYNAEKHAPDNLHLAEENVKIANDSLGTLKLKQGFSAVEVAKINADEALAKSMRGTSSDSIDEAKALMAKAEASPGASAAKTDLAMAKESLLSSEQLFGDAKYPEAINAAEDSKRLSRLVIATRADTRADLSMKGEGQDKKGAVQKSQTQIDCERGYAEYVVRFIPGNKDCLWRVARIYYGDGQKWPKIHEANRDKVSNPHLVLPGQRLKVPMDGSVAKCKKYITAEEKSSHECGRDDKSDAEDQEDNGGALVEEPEY